MRKKSHVSLSMYLVNNIDNELFENHKKAFIVGSVLPDCRPSFVTTKHNMEETFDLVKDYIESLTTESDEFKRIATAYARRLGEVTHYLADFFTYPHNEEFEGNIRQHCIYEKHLKHALRKYIKSAEFVVNTRVADSINTPDELCNYVKAVHREYLENVNDVLYDCEYIVSMSHIVVQSILNMVGRNKRQAA